MKSSVTESRKIVVIHRTVVSLTAGLILGFVLGKYLANSTGHFLLLGLIFSAIVYRTQSVAAIAIVPIAAIAMTATLLQLTHLVFSYRLTIFWLAVVFLICATTVVWVWRASVETKMQVSDVLLLILVALILGFLTRKSTWNAPEALAAVSLTGEDNGTWLNGVTLILQRDAAFDSSGVVLGGPVAGVCGSLFVGIADLFGLLSRTSIDSAVIMMQMYWLLSAFAVLFASRITYLLTLPHVGRLAIVPSTMAATSVLPFSQGFISAGHFTALLAAVFLLASFVVLLEKPFPQPATALVAVAMLLAAADAWWPIRGIVFIAAGAGLVALFVKLGSSRRIRLTALEKAFSRSVYRTPLALVLGSVIGVLVLLFGWQVYQQSWQVYQQIGNSPIDSINSLMSLLSADGGKADVDPLLAVITFALAFLVLSHSAVSSISRTLFRLLVAASIGFPTLLITYGFVHPPYAPQYAAYKALYLICLVITPVSIAGLTVAVIRISGSRAYSVAAVAVVTLLGSATYFEPYPRIKSLLVTQSPAFWVDAAKTELARNPERLVLCLDTREQWQGQDARNCSRQLAGIQGKTNGETDFWTWANICRASSAQLAALPAEFWSKLTLIVTDNQRLVSTDECDRYGWAGPGLPDDERYPIGVLSGVPWSVVRVIGPDGEEVKKSFAYLSGEVPEEVLAKLEQSLAS